MSEYISWCCTYIFHLTWIKCEYLRQGWKCCIETCVWASWSILIKMLKSACPVVFVSSLYSFCSRFLNLLTENVFPRKHTSRRNSFIVWEIFHTQYLDLATMGPHKMSWITHNAAWQAKQWVPYLFKYSLVFSFAALSFKIKCWRMIITKKTAKFPNPSRSHDASAVSPSTTVQSKDTWRQSAGVKL